MQHMDFSLKNMKMNFEKRKVHLLVANLLIVAVCFGIPYFLVSSVSPSPENVFSVLIWAIFVATIALFFVNLLILVSSSEYLESLSGF